MGVYLSKPITDKVSNDIENSRLKCGASSMQGWRIYQEDAHNCCLEFDNDISLFAVYDGHGGCEVAEYASTHLPDIIRKNPAYDQGDYEKALKDAFLEFDSTLITESVIAELKVISDMKSKEEEAPTDGEEGEEDVHELKEEANMPLEEVIAKYKLKGMPKTPVTQRLCSESTPVSPFLRARPSSSGRNEHSSEDDTEVSSSSTGSNKKSAAMTNGVAETNGMVHVDISNEVASSTNAEKPSSPSKVVDSSVSSSSQNGEIKVKDNDAPEEGKEVTIEKEIEEKTPNSVKNSKGRIAKKKAKVTMFQSLLEDTSDSDSDNDESFNANDTTIASSDDEDDNDGVVEGEGVEGEEEEEEGDEEGDEEEGDEEEEEDDDDEEEEEDEDCVTAEDLKRNEEPGYDSGCTAVVALVVKDKLYVANAGDSRAVLCRAGKAIEMSIDHKPEDVPEKERILEAGGRITRDGRVNGGLNLSRALGDHTYKKTPNLDATKQMITALPDVKVEVIDPEQDEFVVLACDGIWNSMNSQEVVDYIRPLIQDGTKLSVICEKLFDSCLADNSYGDGTGCDNMTCVIVKFQSGNKRPASPVPELTENKKAKMEDEQ